jgi:hypothetical protein
MPQTFNTSKKKPIQKKKIHVVWFMDATKTNTFSVAQWILWAFAGFVLLCICVFAFSLSLATKQAIQIASQKKYIQELKSSVVELYLKSSELESPEQDYSAPEVAVTPAQTTAQTSPAAATTLPHETKKQDNALVLFESFSFQPSVSGKGGTISVMLVNKKSDTALSGFTCAVFHLKNGSTLFNPSQENRAGNTCAKGISVKFSKIRPTTFEVPVESSQLRSVEVQFHSHNGSLSQKNTFQISE